MKDIQGNFNKYTENIFVQEIKHNNKISKNILNAIMLGGCLGFIIAGISSYINKNIIFIIDAEKIIFYPQGITMLFYGSLGLLFTINQIYILNFGIGEGYNEFNKISSQFKIVRKIQYGKELELINSLNDIVRNTSLRQYYKILPKQTAYFIDKKCFN